MGDNIELSFNSESALGGKYYELSIPKNLQAETNEVVPQIVLTAEKMYLYIQMKGYTRLPITQWLYLYLSSASYLAQQFLIEQHRNRDFEDDKFNDVDWIYQKVAAVILKKIGKNRNDLELVEFLSTILRGIISNESDREAASWALYLYPKFRMTAIEIMSMCNDVHQKCEQQLKALRIANTAIYKLGCTRKEAWEQIQQYLK